MSLLSPVVLLTLSALPKTAINLVLAYTSFGNSQFTIKRIMTSLLKKEIRFYWDKTKDSVITTVLETILVFSICKIAVFLCPRHCTAQSLAILELTSLSRDFSVYFRSYEVFCIPYLWYFKALRITSLTCGNRPAASKSSCCTNAMTSTALVCTNLCKHIKCLQLPNSVAVQHLQHQDSNSALPLVLKHCGKHNVSFSASSLSAQGEACSNTG